MMDEKVVAADACCSHVALYGLGLQDTTFACVEKLNMVGKKVVF